MIPYSVLLGRELGYHSISGEDLEEVKGLQGANWHVQCCPQMGQKRDALGKPGENETVAMEEVMIRLLGVADGGDCIPLHIKNPC